MARTKQSARKNAFPCTPPSSSSSFQSIERSPSPPPRPTPPHTSSASPSSNTSQEVLNLIPLSTFLPPLYTRPTPNFAQVPPHLQTRITPPRHGNAVQHHTDVLGWTSFLKISEFYFPDVVRTFYCNAKTFADKSLFISTIKGVEIKLTPDILATILQLPTEGPSVFGDQWYSALGRRPPTNPISFSSPPLDPTEPFEKIPTPEHSPPPPERSPPPPERSLEHIPTPSTLFAQTSGISSSAIPSYSQESTN
uniref:Pollen-specific leucine-rich repeat extensin-like protein 2 n=1 Tax=Cicer arietinum TaxID=3827 RepID=A0A1S2Z706_CICAR|nr:pollen-specific leucine-rich repeat extensin-like protein 2 [Cicer arietinum]